MNQSILPDASSQQTLPQGPKPSRLTAPFEPNLDQLQRLKFWRGSTFLVMFIGYMGYYLMRGNLPVAIPLLSQQSGFPSLYDLTLFHRGLVCGSLFSLNGLGGSLKPLENGTSPSACLKFAGQITLIF